MEIVVINKRTGSIVPFRLSENGEIIFNSTDPRDTDEDCYVTTWDNIYIKNQLRKERFNAKRKNIS